MSGYICKILLGQWGSQSLALLVLSLYQSKCPAKFGSHWVASKSIKASKTPEAVPGKHTSTWSLKAALMALNSQSSCQTPVHVHQSCCSGKVGCMRLHVHQPVSHLSPLNKDNAEKLTHFHANAFYSRLTCLGQPPARDSQYQAF